jgi:adenylate kinase family enzyme
LGERIAIIGNAGGGKSALASHLSKAKNLPLHRLDALQWNAGWIPTPQAEFHHQHDALILSERWIIDGFASWESIERRFEAADTIILVEGCPMLPMTGTLLRMIWHIHWELRPHLIELVDSYRGSKWIYHIQSPKELRRFVEMHCAT